MATSMDNLTEDEIIRKVINLPASWKKHGFRMTWIFLFLFFCVTSEGFSTNKILISGLAILFGFLFEYLCYRRKGSGFYLRTLIKNYERPANLGYLDSMKQYLFKCTITEKVMSVLRYLSSFAIVFGILHFWNSYAGGTFLMSSVIAGYIFLRAAVKYAEKEWKRRKLNQNQ